MADTAFDLFVIGAGSAGVRAARMSAGFGARVAIAEAYRPGGTCVIRGCIPKKLLVYAAHYRDDFEDARAYGWTARPEFSWPTLIANKNREIAQLEDFYRTLLKTSGVRLLEGRATLLDAHTVEVAGPDYTASTSWSPPAAGPRCPRSRESSTASPRTRPWSCRSCRDACSWSGAGTSRRNSPESSTASARR